MTAPKRVRLADQRALSGPEFEKARLICLKVQKLVETRDEAARRRGLDVKVALPGNNWDPAADQPFLNRYLQIVRGDYDVINRLRLFAQFSSYDLATQALVTSGRFVPSITAEFDQQMEKRAPIPDQWIDRYCAATQHVPSDILAKYPKVLGEIGWDLDGKPVNHDVYAYQERINLMFEAGIIAWLRERIKSRGFVNILEIGGGYGGLAQGLVSILPHGINYFICDLPESILSSSIYLGIAQPDFNHVIYDGTNPNAFADSPRGGKFVYIPNYFFDDFVAAKMPVDLAINTLSFPEMTEAQVRYYGQHLKQVLGETGVLFEQNEDGRWMGLLDCKAVLSEYFSNRSAIKPRSIPLVAKGRADVWSNKPVSQVIDPRFLPLKSWPSRFKLSLSRLSWLIRKPGWAMIRVRQCLHENLRPETFVFIRKCWNRLGGRMSS